jgi:hypothetical protein
MERPLRAVVASFALGCAVCAVTSWWLRRRRTRRPAFYGPVDAKAADLERLVSKKTIVDHPAVATIVDRVVVFDCARLLAAEDAEHILAHVLRDGPGVLVVRGAFASEEELAALDAASSVFNAIIAAEAASGSGVGDHFAKAGANSRLWNALEKLGTASPATFVAYYANPVLALVSRAWLGPCYQMTSQVNVVRPGGAAQLCHRDYHLGFQSDAAAGNFPSHVHELLSPMLTLQVSTLSLSRPHTSYYLRCSRYK